MTAPPRTTPELTRRIATAMLMGDEMMLDECEQTVHDWLIAEDERGAFIFLIEAARQTVDDLRGVGGMPMEVSA